MPRIYFVLAFTICSLKTFASADTVRIYFDLNNPNLNTQAKATIDSAAYSDMIRADMKIGIVGYADYLGSDSTNNILSEKRAKNVMAYLMGMGMKKDDIEMVTGKGEVKRQVENGKDGYTEDRRVDIIPGGFKEKKFAAPKEPEKIIDFTNVKANETIRMDNLLFWPGSANLLKESYDEAEKLAASMKGNPTLKISIEGHICCSNMPGDTILSVQRAAAIYNYLVEKGIAKERMVYRGFGRTRPLVNPEVTEEDQRMNRRVEIRVLSK